MNGKGQRQGSSSRLGLRAARRQASASSEHQPGRGLHRPDTTFSICRDFLTGKTILLIACSSWNRHFTISGTIKWSGFNVGEGHDAGVGISIGSTTSQDFLDEWIEKGTPEKR
jgi:hypothetical protein